MIVAYHQGTIVYAYKGIFNYNIDHDWSGGVLVDYKKITDNCKNSKNIQPAPSKFLGINIVHTIIWITQILLVELLSLL